MKMPGILDDQIPQTADTVDWGALVQQAGGSVVPTVPDPPATDWAAMVRDAGGSIVSAVPPPAQTTRTPQDWDALVRQAGGSVVSAVPDTDWAAAVRDAGGTVDPVQPARPSLLGQDHRQTNPEQTKLNTTDETAFRAWVQANRTAPGVGNHQEAPYDMRGFWADKPALAKWKAGDHFPDTYKQHGHPTFSVESKYSNGPTDGGRWGGPDGETFFPAVKSLIPKDARIGTPPIRGAGSDVLITATKAAISVPETAIGLIDLFAEGGGAAQTAASLGFRPKEAKAILDTYYSTRQRTANQTLAEAKGFVDVAKAALANPSTIAIAVAESLPQMLMGGAAGKALGFAGALAGAVGEGVMQAGSAAAQSQQQSPTGTVSKTQRAIAASSGFVTGAISRFSGALAAKLGIADADTLLAGAVGDLTASRNLFTALLIGGGQEAVEELSQSASEVVHQNAAEGRPLWTGLDNAVVMGFLTGGVMGAGAQLGDRASRTTPTAADNLRASASEIDQFLATQPDRPQAPPPPVQGSPTPFSPPPPSAPPQTPAVPQAPPQTPPVTDPGSVAPQAPIPDLTTTDAGPIPDPSRGVGSPSVVGRDLPQPASGIASAPVETVPPPVVEVTPKGEPDVHKFSSTQINLPSAQARTIAGFAKSIPTADLAEEGREAQPHVTVKYGLHTTDVEAVRTLLAGEPPIAVTFGTVSIFPDAGSGEVLKVDIDSADLRRLNAKIADALETTDTHPDYQPHATIAYLKPGKGQRYVGTRLPLDQTTIDTLTFTGKDGKVYEITLTGGLLPASKPSATSGIDSHSTPLESEPTPAHGVRRLYRGESPEMDLKAYGTYRGRFFTDNRDEALTYARRGDGGYLVYLDVPEGEADGLLNKDRQYQKDREFILSPEQAATARQQRLTITPEKPAGEMTDEELTAAILADLKAEQAAVTSTGVTSQSRDDNQAPPAPQGTDRGRSPDQRPATPEPRPDVSPGDPAGVREGGGRGPRTYDQAKAQHTFKNFKTRLTKAINAKDWAAVIREADAFEAYYTDSPEPFPDDHHRWTRAKEDAELALRRAEPTTIGKPLVPPKKKPAATVLQEPRVVGGVYKDGYWSNTYTVLAVNVEADGSLKNIKIRWEDGSSKGDVATHMTRWDPKRDRIVSEPAKAARFLKDFTRDTYDMLRAAVDDTSKFPSYDDLRDGYAEYLRSVTPGDGFQFVQDFAANLGANKTQAVAALERARQQKPAATVTSKRYGLMTLAELRELLDVGTGEEPRLAAIELRRRQTAAAEPEKKPVTPQVPNEPGAKYVLPSFVAGSAGVKPQTAADIAKAARAKLIADLKARKAKQAKADENTSSLPDTTPDPADILALVKIVREYLAEGITDFPTVARQFQEEYGAGSRDLDRALEIGWKRLQGETVSVAEVLDAQPDTPEPVTTAVPAEQRAVRLFSVFGAMLAENKLPKDPRELRKLAQRFIGGDPTTYTDDITDAIEAALTKGTAPVVRDVPLLSQIRHAQADEAKLPRAHRTLEKTELQQFSTPLPLAIAAQYAAQVQPGDAILEPTAGTGHLISGLDPTSQNVLASELSPRRVSLLKALGYNTQEGDYLANLDLKEWADVIITNPPWGKYTTGKYGQPIGLKFTPGDVAERFIAKNIRDLKPGGRIVAVMPTTMLGASGLSFRSYLQKEGRIVALIQSPPNAYDTRSTSVESVLLVWDKGVSGDPAKLVAPATWDAYAEAVEAVPPREARHADVQRPPAQPATGRPTATPAPRPTSVGSGSGAVGGRPGSGRPGELGTPAVPPRRDPPVVAPQPGGERGELDAGATPPRAPRATPRESTRGLSPDALAAYGDARRSAFFAPYQLRSDLPGVRHPKLVVEARSLSGVDYPKIAIQFTPRVHRIVASGRASIEQAEQALAAVQANVVGHHGYLAADNVGVGKSREIALTIIDLMERAKTLGHPLRLLVTTKSSDNVADLIDKEMLEAVLDGEPPGFEIVRIKDLKASKTKPDGTPHEPLPQHEHAIYVTDSYNLAPFRAALTEVDLHGIIGDEAHSYKNADAAVGGTWQTLHAAIMLNTPRERQAFAYFTATPAQSVYDYQYLYGLRMWPIDGFQQWVMVVTGQASEADAAGVATATEQGAYNPESVATNTGSAVGSDIGSVVGSDGADVRQGARSRNVGEDVFASRLTPSEAEQIPREWKMQGRFSSRDLWRGGTEFVVHTAVLPAEAKHRYDQFAELARNIIDAAERFGRMDKSGQANRFGPKGQLQAAAKRIQMQPAIEEAINLAKEHVAKGFQAVLSVINVSEMDPNEGNIAAAINLINVRDVDTDGEGGFVDNGEIPEAIIARAELLEQAQGLGTLPDPIQMVTDAFGEDQIALVIGASSGTRQKQVAEFQAGTRSVAVISAAGATGISLDHRVKTKSGAQGRRVFIDVQYEWSASQAIQRYGRVDRAAQVSPPKIMALNFGSASEKKFLATVANRMASLGALSKGGAESTGANALEEFEITGQDALIAARNAWNAQDEGDRALWRGRPFRDSSRRDQPAAMTTATMKEINLGLLWLPNDVANAFWQAFVDERARIREQMGYATEARTRALRGEVLREIPIAADLTLYQVRNEAGHRFGILQGVVMTKMPRLRTHLINQDGGIARTYLNFTATEGEASRIISGLEIPWTRIKAVAQEFGTRIGAEKIETAEQAESAMRAGDRLTLSHPINERPWVIRQRTDAKIVIDGAKMADRDLLLRHGATYSPVGNFWHVIDLAKFLERFPVVQPEAKPGEAGPSIDIDDDEGGGTSALPQTGGREIPRPRRGTPSGRVTEAVRPTAIIKELQKALGDIPIRIGRFKERARGIYKNDVREIRLKTAGDLRAVFHEQGHHFDISVLRINRTDPRWNQELIDLGQETSMPSYTLTQQRKEGAAEFFVLYLMRPEEAESLAPNYFAEIERRLATVPEMRDALLSVREHLSGYIGLSSADRGRARVDDATEDPAIVRGLKQVIRDPWDVVHALARETVDDLTWLGVAVKQMRDGRPLAATNNAETLARIARGASGKAAGFLEHGVRGLDGQFLSNSLAEAISPVRDDLKEHGRYLVALRAVELIEEHGKLAGMSNAQAHSIIAEDEARPDAAAFAQAKLGVYAYQDALLTYAQEAGVFSRAQVGRMRRMHRAYVPMQRLFDVLEAGFTGGGGAKRIANRTSPVKRLSVRGSGRDVLDPYESIVGNTFKMVDTVEKNKAMQALTRLAARSAGSARWLARIPDPQVATTFNLAQLTPQIAEALEAAGLTDIPDNLDEVLDTMVTVFMPAAFVLPDGRQIVTVLEDGKREFWQVNHTALYEAITAIGPRDTSLLIQWLETPAKLLRATATFTPGFMLARNPARDTVVAWLQSRHGFILGYDTIRGLISQVRGDADARLFWTTGIAQATFAAQDRKERQDVVQNIRAKRGLGKRIIRHPIDMWRALGTQLEVATRLGEFKLALDAGGIERGVLRRLMDAGKARPALTEEAVTVATLAGRDVSQDFAKAGRTVREINRAKAFFSAQVGGWVRMAETAKRDPIGLGLKLGLLATVSAILWVWNHDDDEYDEIPEWEKHAFWHVKIPGNDHYLLIAKPFEWGYIADLTEAALTYAAEGDPERFKKMLASVTGPSPTSTLINLFGPTGLLPALEAWANYSSLRDAPIVKPFDVDRLETDLQFNDWTSETAKKLGAIMPVAPAVIDHLIGGYTAGVGRGIVTATDAGLRLVGQAPAQNRATPPTQSRAFVGNVLRDQTFGASSASIQDLYDVAEAIAQIDASIKADVKGGDRTSAKARLTRAERDPLWARRGAILHAKAQFKNLGRELNAVLAASPTQMSPDQKAARRNQIYERMVALARQALGRPALKTAAP